MSLDNADWMSKLPQSMVDGPLCNIAIPGSHDSFTSSLSNSEFGPDCSPQVATLVKAFKREQTLYDWSKCQLLNTTQQLKAGIRYFDLRACLHNGDFYFTHDLLSGKIVDFLNEVKSFLNGHNKEVVLLDFNHFYAIDTDEIHKRLIRLIIDTISREKLCLFVGVNNLKLSDLWSASQQVIVFYQNPIAEDHPELWPEDSITAPWPNTEKPDELLAYLEGERNKPRPDNMFYVTQGVLTPRIDVILKSLFNATTLETLASEVSKRLIEFFSKQKAGAGGLNITIIDFCEKDTYIPTVLALNKA